MQIPRRTLCHNCVSHNKVSENIMFADMLIAVVGNVFMQDPYCQTIVSLLTIYFVYSVTQCLGYFVNDVLLTYMVTFCIANSETFRVRDKFKWTAIVFLWKHFKIKLYSKDYL